MTLYLKTLHGNLLQLPVYACGPDGRHLKDWISITEKLPVGEIVLSHNGLLVQEGDQLKSDGLYNVNLRLRGGKGGFGSMLRMLGAQIEKTTNHEACRDLSGRRMRDVNNEKKLADWISNKADREREREEKRQAKLERLRSGPRHRFVDPNYHKQKSEVSDSLDEAITQGILASVDEPSTSSGDKRKHDEEMPGGSKKSRLWVGVEDDSDSDDSESEEESETPSSVKLEKDQQTDDPTSLQDTPTNQKLPSSSCDSPLTNTDKTTLSVQELPSSLNDSHVSPDDVVEKEACLPSSSGDSRTSQGTVIKEETGDMEATKQNLPEGDITKADVAMTKDSKNEDINLAKMESVTELESAGLEKQKTEQDDIDLAKIESVTELEATGLEKLNTEQKDIDLDKMESVTELEAAGLEKLNTEQKDIDLDKMESVTELEAAGLEKLKTELMSRGLKCGGTLQERARRLFSVKGLSPDQIDPSLKAKPSRGKRKQRAK